MNQSRPRNRRLVTYGSSNKSQLQPKNMPSRSSAVNLGNQQSLHLSTNKLPKREKDDETSSSRSLTIEEESIYDLPSSDEEHAHQVVRRKRRRHSHDINPALVHQDISGSQSSHTVVDTNTKSAGSSSQFESYPKTPLLQIKKVARDSKLQGSSRDGASQTSSNKSHSESTVQPRRKCPRLKKPSDTIERVEQRDFQAEPICLKKLSPSLHVSPRSAEVSMQSITPGRKRLIDSLGINEESVDVPSPNTPTGSQLSSPIAPHTPTRFRDHKSPSLPSENQNENRSQESAITLSPHLRSSNVTYARQRSFLDDNFLAYALSAQSSSAALESSEIFSQPLEAMNTLPHARLFMIEDENNDDGSVRSIHELRQAGGNARYRGAVESIFEDIEDLNISVSGRCNAFVQLCGKLLDPKLASQFVECNFDKRLVDCLSKDFDIVSATLALSALSLSFIGRPLPYILATVAWPKLLDVSVVMLDTHDEISAVTRAQGSKIPKNIQKSVQNLALQIPTALSHDTPISTLSPGLIALHCLKATLASFQGKGETPSGLPLLLLKQLIDLLLPGKFYKGSSSEISLNGSMVFILGLSILEAHTASGGLLQKEHLNILSSLPRLHGLLHVKINESKSNSQTIHTLFIRVILNVTNSNSFLCDKFATPGIVEELAEIVTTNFGGITEDTLPRGNKSLDTIVLALGALINLAEQSEAARTIFVNSPDARGSLLDHLLPLFLDHVHSTSKADSFPKVNQNVAVGYLAVLLLALCLNPKARSHIKQSFQAKGLTVVMSTVNEFLQYHRKIEQDSHAREMGGFHARLEDLISQIRQDEI